VYTRCPGCHTVHPVNAALLASGGGRYRCGKCNKVSNALEALFDAWPAAGARAPMVGQLPVLGLTLDLQAAARSRRSADAARAGDATDVAAGVEAGVEAGDEAGEERRGTGLRWLVRLAWITAALVIAVVVAFEVAEFQGQPLLERAPLRSAMEGLGLREPPSAAPFRDLGRIHVVSRELRSHPTLPGRLRLNATIVNRAAQAQPWPDLEITLLDAAGQQVAQRRFSPAEYLAEGGAAAETSSEAATGGMAPQAYLPLVLVLEDPGRRAVGFELEFR
jgi:predicted Zn finger-like uncharacterized protein